MARRTLVVPVVFMILLTSSCDWLDRLVGESDKWRELVKVQTDAMVRAIPGERYLQIIDDLNGPDPVKRQAAQTFLAKLGNFDPTVPWQGTVEFRFDQSKPLHADVFWGFSPSVYLVEQQVPYTFNSTISVMSTVPLPKTAQELDAEIDGKVDAMLGVLTGPAEVRSVPDNYPQISVSYPESIMPAGASTEGVQPKNALAKRNQVASLLKELFKSQYNKKFIPTGGAVLQKDWLAMDLRNYLFVLIPDSDWQIHKNDQNFYVGAVLHRSDNPNVTYNKTAEMEFQKQQFEENMIDGPKYIGKVRWAVRNLTGNSILMPQDVEQIKAMEKALEDLKQLQDKHDPNVKTSWWNPFSSKGSS